MKDTESHLCEEKLIDSKADEFFNLPADELTQFTSAFQDSDISAIKLTLESFQTLNVNALVQAIHTLKYTNVTAVDLSENEFNKLSIDRIAQFLAAFEGTNVTIIHLNKDIINNLYTDKAVQIFSSLPFQIKRVIMDNETLDFPKYYLNNKHISAYQQKLVKYLIQYAEKQIAEKEADKVKTIVFPFFINEELLNIILPLLENEQTNAAKFIYKQLLHAYNNVKTAIRDTDNKDVDGDRKNSIDEVDLVAKATQLTSTCTSGSIKNVTQDNDDSKIYTERLRNLNPEELNSYVNSLKPSSDSLSNFLYKLRFFHGHEIMELLKHKNVVENIFSKDSDYGIELMLTALNYSVSREEINSETLVNFLEHYKLQEIICRGVTVRYKFFELLRNSFRKPNECIAEFLLMLFTNHREIYLFDKNKILFPIVLQAIKLPDAVTREKILTKARLHMAMLRTTLMALFDEIQHADKSDIIRPLLNYMLLQLGTSLKANESVTKEEAALLAKLISKFFHFNNNVEAKRSHNLLTTILGDPGVSVKYRLLLLEELKKINFVLEKYYRTKLDSLNRIKNSFVRFFGMRRCVDASDTLTEAQVECYISLH